MVGAPVLSFPASQIFIHCHIFPAEFSLVATFKAPRLKEKVKEEMQKPIELLSFMMFFSNSLQGPLTQLWSGLTKVILSVGCALDLSVSRGMSSSSH